MPKLLFCHPDIACVLAKADNFLPVEIYCSDEPTYTGEFGKIKDYILISDCLFSGEYENYPLDEILKCYQGTKNKEYYKCLREKDFKTHEHRIFLMERKVA